MAGMCSTGRTDFADKLFRLSVPCVSAGRPAILELLRLPLNIIEELVERSQAEDSLIEYRATTGINDPNVVRFFEY